PHRGQVAEPTSVGRHVDLTANLLERFGQLVEPGLTRRRRRAEECDRFRGKVGFEQVFEDSRQQGRQVWELFINDDGYMVLRGEGAAQGREPEGRLERRADGGLRIR